MKGFFELLGFASMAIISGFLVFTLVGRNKQTLQPDTQLLRSENSISDHSGYRELPTISKGKNAQRSGTASTESPRSTHSAAPASANSTDRLRDLYADQQFVNATIQRWKRAVADAHETHTLRPDVLMSNIIVRSYLADYGQREFKQDVAEHAGDCAISASNALKSYEYGWSMRKLMDQHNLSRHFPATETSTAAQFKPKSKVAEANFFAAGKKSAAYTAPQVTKPAATTTAAEAGFRAMVAKDEGFSSWAGLQKLADMETKQNAERRVKRLLSAARVK